MLKSSGSHVDDQSTVVFDLEFFSGMAKLIGATPKRVLANYLGWSVVQFAMPYLPENVYALKNNFDKILTGENAVANRESICLDDVKESFEIGLSSMYVRKHLDRRIKSDVEELFSYIKDRTRWDLEQVDWMEERTNRAAIEKLEAMRGSVAYAEELFDDQKIDDYYSELDIAPGHCLTSALNIAAFKRTAMFEDFGDKYIWKKIPGSADMEAFFVRKWNLVCSIIGHGIIHAFDSDGRHFDRDGREGDWWDNATETKFLDKTQCLVNQYDNFIVDDVGLTVNGTLTLNENIADNGGIVIACQAYNEWASRNQIPEMCLPDLEQYTAQQMFWISAASVTCEGIVPEILRNRMSFDEHSPSVARGTIVFANVPEFAKDFQCAPGSRMNPVDRCSLW